MSHFVIGNNLSFFLAHDAVLLFLAHKHLLHGIKKVFLADIFPAALYGIDSRFVDHIGKIGSNSAAGCQRNGVKVHGFVHFHVLGMYF